MIVDLLANHAWLYPVGAAFYALLEFWLGRTPTTQAGSVLELIVLGFQKLAALFKHEPKGVTPMPSTNPNVRTIQVVVDGPTYDALGAFVGIAKAIEDGQDAKAAVMAAVPSLVMAFGQISSIQGDYKLDRVSVIEAVSQRVGDLGEAFLLAKAAPAVPIK